MSEKDNFRPPGAPKHLNRYPPPSKRQHLSCGDCLDVRRENGRNSSVLYFLLLCVLNLEYFIPVLLSFVVLGLAWSNFSEMT